jgi:hypothetical protein
VQIYFFTRNFDLESNQPTRMKKLFVMLVSLALLFACQSPQSLYEDGQYQKSFKRYYQKIERRTQKQSQVEGMERAFQAANSAALSEVDSLLIQTDSSKWLKINVLHKQVLDRHQKVDAISPIVAKNGYTAQFAFIPNIEQSESESRAAAADYLYNQALKKMQLARTEDRLLARQAHAMLSKIKTLYYPNYKNTDALLAEALDFGTTSFLVEKSGVNSFHTENFFDYLMPRGNGFINQNWHSFDLSPIVGKQYDYTLELDVNHIDVGSESRYVTNNTYSKQIEKEVVIVRDTAGNVISRTPVYETVCAIIEETRIMRNSSAGIVIRIVSVKNKQEILSDQYATNHFVDLSWIKVYGDERALESVPVCHNIGVPMGPSEWSVVDEMANNIRYQVVRDWDGRAGDL